MAYFVNSTEGEQFKKQCSRCKYGQKPCPIYQVHFFYNYDTCNNQVTRQILDDLISDNDTCAMFEEFRKDFEIIEKNSRSGMNKKL